MAAPESGRIALAGHASLLVVAVTFIGLLGGTHPADRTRDLALAAAAALFALRHSPRRSGRCSCGASERPPAAPIPERGGSARRTLAAAERAGFRPVAFARTIQIMMVPALADAPFETGVKAQLKALPNLVAYLERIRERFWK